MARVSKMFGFCVAALLWALLLSCTSSSEDESLQAYREQAEALVDQQQFREAVTVYQQIVQLDPKDDEAYYQLALLHLVMGEPEDIQLAHQALLKVVKLKGARSDAHLKLAYLYIYGGEPAKARLHVEAILLKEPTHSEAHLIRGVSFIREKRLQNGITEFRKAIESDPQSDTAYLELARAYALQRDFAASESILRERLHINSQSIETIIALGDVCAAAGKDAEAVTEYLRGLEIDGKRSDLYSRLAEVRLRQRRFNEAEGYYRRWAEAVPDDAQAHAALAQFYRSKGRLSEAETSLQRAWQLDPSSRIVHEALITFYLETHRLQEAGREIDFYLKSNPRDVVGRILQARLVLEQGDMDKAAHLLQELSRDNPKSAAIYHNLGIVLARRQDLSQAVSALKEARAMAPDSIDIRVTLAQVYLAQGSVNSAINEAEGVLEVNPQNTAVLKLLVDAHLLAEDTKRAHQTLQELSGMLPDDTFVHHRLGVVSSMQQRPAEAIAHLERALEHAPSSIESLEEIASILISQGKMSQAYERVRHQVALNPRDPRFHNLLGRILVQSRKFPEAEAAFKKAMSLDGMLLPTYANLSELYTRQGKVEQAIREFETIVEKNPQQLGALMTLGILHEQRKDYSRAMAKYEQALRIDARFAPAANNLAWILVEHIGDKERALSYAEAAWQTLPHDPYVADTLGWIYYHKQLYGKSASVLKQAVDRLPTHPLILYHYGIVLHANKQRDEARKALDKFLTLAPEDPHAHEAKKLLAELT
jgi:tetratricopeptide (TPR) repeat protein